MIIGNTIIVEAAIILGISDVYCPFINEIDTGRVNFVIAEFTINGQIKSFQAPIAVCIAKTNTPGNTIGDATFKKILNGLAPSTLAASIISFGTAA